MQWTCARDVGEQVLHLVGENPPSFQVDVLGIVRRKRNGNQLHHGLFRRPAAFMVVASPACGRNVVPDVEPALGQGRNVVTRQVTRRKLLRTVQAKIRVSFEQRAIVERRNVLVAGGGKTLAGSLGCDDRIDFDLAAAAVEGVVAAVYRVKRGAACIRDLLVMIEPNGLPLVDPLERHSGHVGSKDLLRDV